MTPAVTTAIFAACLGLLIMVVSAHDGHQHTPGTAMSPKPAASVGNFMAPTTVMGVFLALMVAIFVAGERA
ncbi:hypothetical protein V6N13_134970 [Hibiscus sabdariffa]|uniref:Uncharacterized protein n=1 Tax=Hibiscus sabdariffa TaxID=183260 RepID=A0ABR2R5C1_9ROSI